MKAITKASRINNALKVIQHMNTGMKVIDACKTVGMPRSTFYYIVDKHPEAIADFQALIDRSNRKQLEMILEHKVEILEKLIQDGLSDKTKPRDRMAIYIKLSTLMDDLIDSLQRDEQGSGQDADSFLTGPKLVQAESSFASS